MEQLKKTLSEAFAMGPRAKVYIDGLLDSNDAYAVADLKADLSQFEVARLRLLRCKLACGDVVARTYHRELPDGREQGCLHYWLQDIRSKHELMNQPFASEEMLKTVWRVVRFWDYGVLTAPIVAAVLDELIAERERGESEAAAA